MDSDCFVVRRRNLVLAAVYLLSCATALLAYSLALMKLSM
jgi:hypothetical protein